uniref:Uncharacterized protein n=1 Tax=Anguilla anguilla TaxID=7936 RepID=A0A0E9RIW1_ANGAN
MQLAKCHNFF